MEKFRVAVTDERHASYDIERKILEEAGAELAICNCVTAEDIARECADADGILLDMAPMTAEAIEKLNKCKVIVRYGVGYDNVDVEACTKKGILVCNVPDYCALDVSDHALALLLTCLRATAERDRRIRLGEWNIQAANSVRLAGKTLGVLGFGRIARELVHKCSGFGFSRVLAYDPYLPEDFCRQHGAEKADLETVLANSDFLSLHMPVTPETRGMINADRLKLMKKNVILINTARGALIDDEALVAALQNGDIAWAGLDTHNKEPLNLDSPYMDLDNVVLTDHTAYSTKEGVIELKTKAAQAVATVLNGGKPAFPINKI